MYRKHKVCLAFLSVLMVLYFAFSVFAVSGNGDVIVYITSTGGRYHSESCGSLSRSKFSITLEDAIREGYTRCERCNPPVYTGDVVPYETREVHQGGGSGSYSTRKSSEEETSTAADEQRQSYATTYDNKNSVEKENDSGKSDTSVGTILAYIVLGILFIPPALEVVCMLIFVPIWRIIVHIYNLIPCVKKKKELLRIEEQRLQEEAAEQERIANENRLKEKLQAQKGVFINDLSSLLQRLTETSYPFEQEKALRFKKLKMLLESNHACIRNGNVCDTSGEYYGNRCTLYYTSEAKCYHLYGCRYSGTYHSHILRPPSDKKPCSICKPDLFDTAWMTECEKLCQDLEALIEYENITSYENKKRLTGIAIKIHSIPHQASDEE